MSRQVRAEAEYIFRNHNLFVLVKINLEISSAFYNLIRPVVLAWHDRAKSFKHHAMALDLSPLTSFTEPDLYLLPGYQNHSPSSCFMIAGVDIPWLVRALSTIDGVYESLGCPLLPHTYLSISPSGPLKDATTREVDDFRLGKLLKPFFRQGILEAYLDDSVNADYAYRIADKIQEPPLRAKASVDQARTFTRIGDEAFRCGRHVKAIHAYQEALDCLPFFYGFTEAWRNDGFYSEGLPADIFSDLFNRQRAARIRFEISRKALEPAFLARSRAHRLNSLARAGSDYALKHFDRGQWPVECVYTYQASLVGVELDIQLGIIIDFESDPYMKTALQTLITSTKNSAYDYEFQWEQGFYDYWVLDVAWNRLPL